MDMLWYSQPAANWNEALPLGNGHMGAMCFGGTRLDRFQLNDDTLWSGGPIDRINPDARQGVERVRALLREGKLLLALSGHEGASGCLWQDGTAVPIPFNGCFTSITVE